MKKWQPLVCLLLEYSRQNENFSQNFFFCKIIFFSREIEDEDERLRVYQLDRLKYYYAVCETDSPETADEIYKEFDGQDYGDSGVNGKWFNFDEQVVIGCFSGS